MDAWNQLGHKVTKAQKGIRILAPMITIRKKKTARRREGDHQAEPARIRRLSFADVFDVSQTEGAPLPDLSERVVQLRYFRRYLRQLEAKCSTQRLSRNIEPPNLPHKAQHLDC
jgi:hypothetical protein